MEVMRHSDLRLTSKVYTDASLLPTGDAYEQLPRYDAQPEAQTDSQMVVNGCPGMSSNDKVSAERKLRITLENQGNCAVLSADVPESQGGDENWGTRIRT